MLQLTKNILMVTALATLAVAQTPATTTAKPGVAKTPPAATKPAAKPAAAKATPAPAKKAAAKAPAVATVDAAAKPKPSAAAPRPVAAKASSRRDPFVNPVKLRADRMATAPACSTGARCLMIDQVVLKGVVKTQQGMIAMVENSSKKQYNLREKDPVYNGFVLKITGDSVVFKENSMDNMGRPATREVVKRVTVPVV
ncbi:MAG TPA: hypothetical protein VM056_05460 [Terriglobales bacterium]|nr:hypothetical protein [Terriglobales bacterium]